MGFLTVMQTINERRPNEHSVMPSFNALSPDLLSKGGELYGFWDGEQWRQSMGDFIRFTDKQMMDAAKDIDEKYPNAKVTMGLLQNSHTNELQKFKKFIKELPSTPIVFDSKIHFLGEELKREDYATKTLDYRPASGATPAFDEMFGVLYEKQELEKVLWFCGALLVGDMPKIQKFLYLYGGKGTGKGTMIKIVEMLFDGYTDEVDLMTLTGNSPFATAQVKERPVLIDADCDISKITNDTYLLKLTAHETIEVNSKYKVPYTAKFDGMLIAASNERYKVKHVDAGITRRAVVVEPANRKLSSTKYHELMDKIKFEIPAIAQKAIDLYLDLGISYFDNYVDLTSIEETDYMYAFVEEYKDRLGDPCTLASAATLYLSYLNDIGFDTSGYKKALKTKLKKYYREYSAVKKVGKVTARNVYSGFKEELFHSSVGSDAIVEETNGPSGWIQLSDKVETMKVEHPDWPAQYATPEGTPMTSWDSCNTTLADIDECVLHYVRVPLNYIVIDFDLKGRDGNKSLERNLEAATKFPETYCELSKSGAGIHLHYIYDGDPTLLSSLYDDDIEIKVYKGKSSLRRKLTMANELPVATISTGLPIKEENKKMYSDVKDIIWTEQKIRTAIKRNLRKEYHSSTKSSVDFIYKILTDAKEADLIYDVTDLAQAITLFAANSTHQSRAALKTVSEMPFKNEVEYSRGASMVVPNQQLWVFDVEVYPNVFIVVAKSLGTGDYIKLINPDKYEIEDLLRLPLMGFNNLKYDNHIMYGALSGEDNLELYNRSRRIIDKEKGGYAYNSYGLSYLDIFEMSTKKQSLKKWEAELDIKHDEMDWPWDEPLPEDKWERAVEYCTNDVDATEAVFYECRDDYNARCILSAISGLSINHKTQDQTAQIIFGDDKNAKKLFKYTDLSETFPGYKCTIGEKEIETKTGTKVVRTIKSEYLGEDPSEGGYAWSIPGFYEHVGLFDVESMHPTSIEVLDYFGPYTKNYSDLKGARIAIKHHDYDAAREMFDGRLVPFLTDEDSADKLSYALKIPINIVYGMISASFENPFTIPENYDNIVAKRGALFMLLLKHECLDRGYNVVHIKTDSIKIANFTEEAKQFVFEFGKKYGYDFEHEATYSKFCIVDKANYIAQYEWAEKTKKIGTWEATGDKFKNPYVFKKLFSKENLTDSDFFITKASQSAIYLDDQFVGKVAKIYASRTGYDVFRVDGEKKAHVLGTKDAKWRLSSDFRGLKDLDMKYYEGLCIKAIENINEYTSTEAIIESVPKEFREYILPF